MMKQVTTLILIFTFGFAAQAVNASSGAVPLVDVDVATDNASRQRGFEVYYNICRMCHQLKYVKYQYLADIGYDKAQIDKLRGAKMVNESIKATMPDDVAASVFGAVPPDISLMAKARKHGPSYIYTLLTSYHEKEENVYDNKLFPGIKMPDPLGYSVASETARPKIEEQLNDVVAFLTWASDPQADERKSMGIYVMAYLVLLSVLLYFVKKRVWRRLPPPVSENL